MANEKIIAKKQEEVSKLAEKIKNAKLVILTDYRGITVEDVTKLRADFRKSNSEYSVIKNNIIPAKIDKKPIININLTNFILPPN